MLVRLTFLMVALGYWAATLCGRLTRKGAVVLCYHSISADERERFARQMSYIADRAIDIAQYPTVEAGRLCLPRVCVTFDDGFACLLDNAFTTLKNLRIPCTVFAVPGNGGCRPQWQMPRGHPDAQRPLMQSHDIEAAAKALDIRFGSHTLSHPDLATIPVSDVHKELAGSKAAMEHILRVPVQDLAFPYGSYDARVLSAAQAAGYKRIFTLDPRVYRERAADGTIGRFSMSPGVWWIEFILTCAGAYNWLHVLRKVQRRIRTMRKQDAYPEATEP